MSQKKSKSTTENKYRGADSYLKKLDPDYDTESQIITQYDLIMATAKRARQKTDQKVMEYHRKKINGEDIANVFRDFHAVSEAAQEIYDGKVQIVIAEEDDL